MGDAAAGCAVPGAAGTGVEPAILYCQRFDPSVARVPEIEGVPVRWRRLGRLGLLDFAGFRPDLLLCIDYRPNYRVLLFQRPRTPLIVWVRDPWGPEEHGVLADLRLPGSAADEPHGVRPPDHRSMRWVWRASRLAGRRLVFGTTADFLRRRVGPAYGIPEPQIRMLPNALEIDPGGVDPSERPSVLFLARLDPVKRPWVAFALAEAFPEVEFRFAGQAHFSGRGTWKPECVPENCRLLGHIDGEEKRRVIASSWVLLNTSIHEGLPVSVQEALACGVPLLSTLDPEGTASRFGIFAGAHGGDGLAALPALREGLRRLIGDGELRRRLGREGRAWVTSVHNTEAFLKAFGQLAEAAGRPLTGLAAATR